MNTNNGGGVELDVVDALVSVIIPTYNRKALLLESVNSCLGQTWKNVEVIIVDDGSEDGTEALVSEMLASKWSVERVHYVRQRNAGASAARNYGLRLAKGRYIQFLDSDDILDATKLSKQVSLLEQVESREVPCCYCLGTMGASYGSAAPKTDIGLTGLWSGREIVNALASKIVHGLPTPAPLWRMEFLARHDGWREDIALGDDLEYHVRLLANVGTVQFVKEPLFFIREHSGPRLSTGELSASALASILRTRRAVHAALRDAGLWQAKTERHFLGAIRTLYANAMQSHDEATVRHIEDWVLEISGPPWRNPSFALMIAVRRVFGRHVLLSAHRFFKHLRIG